MAGLRDPLLVSFKSHIQRDPMSQFVGDVLVLNQWFHPPYTLSQSSMQAQHRNLTLTGTASLADLG